jgi:hypothetical protein
MKEANEACGRSVGGSSRCGALEGRGRADPGGAVEDEGGWFPITGCCIARARCAFRLKRRCSVADDPPAAAPPLTHAFQFSEPKIGSEPARHPALQSTQAFHVSTRVRCPATLTLKRRSLLHPLHCTSRHVYAFSKQSRCWSF